MLRVQPRARRNQVDGLAAMPDGAVALKVAVTAPPEDGKANAALLRLLARTWGLAPRRLALVAGAKDRVKTVLVAGDAAQLLATLSERTPTSHA